MSQAVADARLAAARAWLGGLSGEPPPELVPASADASFRRYFRLAFAGQSCILMDAPPPQEDCRPFVRVAGMMQAAGLHVPEILAQNIDQGFLLLSDLGNRTYLDVLNDDNASALFADARQALVRWQLATRAGALPPYDEPLLRRELALFPDWYVARHRGLILDSAQRQALAEGFDLIVHASLAQPIVNVHRDFMPRNLMLSSPNPGVLDFQDAVLGPLTYDVVSLYKDAFLSWEEERVLDGAVRYWEQARAVGLPVSADFGDFYRDFEWMGLHRHLKVLGIFARIRYRDGKDRYLADSTRFVDYVRKVCARYGALKPMARLLDFIEDAPAAAVGYRFQDRS